MKQRDYRWVVVFGANLLLLWLYGLANNCLVSLSVYIFPSGLLVVYAALRLDALHGYTATALTALACDALMPVPFGTSVALLGLVHTAVFYGRQRFPREEPVFATVVALVANLFVFLALSFALIGRNPRPGVAWLRLFSDLVASQIVLALITPWFFALQNHVFAWLQQHPETGRRTVT
jgi:rod shape-determining protein MreD